MQPVDIEITMVLTRGLTSYSVNVTAKAPSVVDTGLLLYHLNERVKAFAPPGWTALPDGVADTLLFLIRIGSIKREVVNMNGCLYVV